MQVQSHQRIASIRKVSRYFLFLSSLALILTPIVAIGAILAVFLMPGGSMDLGQYLLKNAVVGSDAFDILKSGLTMQMKLLSALGLVVFFGLLWILFKHLNHLLNCFYEGEIFNRKAIFHAKKAFFYNCLGTAVYLAGNLVCIVYASIYGEGGHFKAFGYLLAETVDSMIWIGITLLILWPLEIGVDLNEESELTI